MLLQSQSRYDKLHLSEQNNLNFINKFNNTNDNDDCSVSDIVDIDTITLVITKVIIVNIQNRHLIVIMTSWLSSQLAAATIATTFLSSSQ